MLGRHTIGEMHVQLAVNEGQHIGGGAGCAPQAGDLRGLNHAVRGDAFDRNSNLY
jgi:hypothetical protein